MYYNYSKIMATKRIKGKVKMKEERK